MNEYEKQLAHLHDRLRQLELDFQVVADQLGQATQSLAQSSGGGSSSGGGGASGPALTRPTGISDASGQTPGSGEIDVGKLNAVTGDVDYGAVVTCYSWFTTPIGPGVNIMWSQDSDGNYWVVAEDCP